MDTFDAIIHDLFCDKLKETAVCEWLLSKNSGDILPGYEMDKFVFAAKLASYITEEMGFKEVGMKFKEMKEYNSRVGRNKQKVKDSSHLKEKRGILARKFGHIYAAAVWGNFIPYMLEEMKFIAIMLTISSNESQSLSVSHSKDGCANFAYSFFSYHALFLKCLDNGTLELLASNEDLRRISSKFICDVEACIQLKKKIQVKSYFESYKNLKTESRFIIRVNETDTSKHFPSEKSFIAFKKQRDCFYGILNDWKDSWFPQESRRFFVIHRKRVDSLLAHSRECHNIFRLANLFSCTMMECMESEIQGKVKKFGLIYSRKGIELRKVVPCVVNDSAKVTFPGIQGFYKNFVSTLAEKDFFFVKHLSDNFISRIVALNEANLEEINGGKTRGHLYLDCLWKLRLLAKFLSYITFLPYQSKEEIPLYLKSDMVLVRAHIQPPLDLHAMLNDSLENGRAALTIPWILEFIRGVDHTALLTSYYSSLIGKLWNFVSNLKKSYHSLLWDPNKVAVNRDYVVLLISSYFSHFTNTFKLARWKCLYHNTEDVKTDASPFDAISYDFDIGENELYVCCPQLFNIFTVMSPIARSHRLEFPDRAIESQLESLPSNIECVASPEVLASPEVWVLKQAPSDVREIVNFISEQIAGTFISNFPFVTLRETMEIIHMYFGSVYNVKEWVTKNEKKRKEMSMEFEVKGQAVFQEKLDLAMASSYKNIKLCLRSLLKHKIRVEYGKEDLLNILVEIAYHQFSEMIRDWISTHINLKEIILPYERKLWNEVENLNRFNFNPTANVAIQNLKKKKELALKVYTARHSKSDTIGLDVILIETTVFMSSLADGCEKSVDEIKLFIKQLTDSFTQSPDMDFLIFYNAFYCIQELAFTLVLFAPSCINDEILGMFLSMWRLKEVAHLPLHLEYILKDLYMAKVAALSVTKRRETANAISRLFIFAAKNGLICPNFLQGQILRFMCSSSVPAEILGDFAMVLRNVFHSYANADSQLIDWVADFVPDTEDG